MQIVTPVVTVLVVMATVMLRVAGRIAVRQLELLRLWEDWHVGSSSRDAETYALRLRETVILSQMSVGFHA